MAYWVIYHLLSKHLDLILFKLFLFMLKRIFGWSSSLRKGALSSPFSLMMETGTARDLKEVDQIKTSSLTSPTVEKGWWSWIDLQNQEQYESWKKASYQGGISWVQGLLLLGLPYLLQSPEATNKIFATNDSLTKKRWRFFKKWLFQYFTIFFFFKCSGSMFHISTPTKLQLLVGWCQQD